ncbi:MAG: hypothetical protein HQL65_13355 [Magnetococcales bacterium]|nr:hypothetical protein [Magnetococcales bacterium]
MLRTVDAEIGENGEVYLLEPLVLQEWHRALVIILGPLEEPGVVAPLGSGALLMSILNNNQLPPESRLSAEEIDAHIQAERDAWD